MSSVAQVIVGSALTQHALLVIADSSFHEQQADNLRVEYERLRGSYRGHPVIDNDLFDTEVICRIISNMKRGKASGIDGLSVEHSGVFRGGGTGQCPPLWPEHKIFLNTLNQKKI